MVVPAHPSETGSYFNGGDYVTFYTKGYIERREAIELVYYLSEHIIDFSGVKTRLDGRPLEPPPNPNPFAYMTIIEPADLFDPYFFESKFPTSNPKKIDYSNKHKEEVKERSRLFHSFRRFKVYTFWHFYRDNPELRPPGFNPNVNPHLQPLPPPNPAFDGLDPHDFE